MRAAVRVRGAGASASALCRPLPFSKETSVRSGRTGAWRRPNARMPGTPSFEILDLFVRAGMGDAVSQQETRAYLAEGDTLAVNGKRQRIAGDGSAF